LHAFAPPVAALITINASQSRQAIYCNSGFARSARQPHWRLGAIDRILEVIEITEPAPPPMTPPPTIMDLAIQIACVALLSYWTFVLVAPFLTIIVWSIILADLLYPGFDWIVRRLRVPRAFASLLLVVLSLIVLFGPAAWLGSSLVGTIRTLAMRIGSGEIAIPPPGEAVKNWPFIGDRLFETWSLASTNLKAALVQFGPQLRPISGTLLRFAGSTGTGMLKFVTAVVISGFLLPSGPRLVDSAKLVAQRIAPRHGNELVGLIGATIRNLARGVIGVSIAQALLAGVGFIVAGVPAPGLFSFLVLLLGIIQIGAAIVIIPLIIWAWVTMDTTMALFFTLYMVPVTLLDNFLRPFVMAHGLKTPISVVFIGAIGGILTHGIIGVFVGPIVLAIAWEVLAAWVSKPADGWNPVSLVPEK
jgi:predicted PurR-regulated permease PerM